MNIFSTQIMLIVPSSPIPCDLSVLLKSFEEIDVHRLSDIIIDFPYMPFLTKIASSRIALSRNGSDPTQAVVPQPSVTHVENEDSEDERCLNDDECSLYQSYLLHPILENVGVPDTCRLFIYYILRFDNIHPGQKCSGPGGWNKSNLWSETSTSVYLIPFQS
jgi:hypothetical protein